MKAQQDRNSKVGTGVNPPSSKMTASPGEHLVLPFSPPSPHEPPLTSPISRTSSDVDSELSSSSYDADDDHEVSDAAVVETKDQERNDPFGMRVLPRRAQSERMLGRPRRYSVPEPKLVRLSSEGGVTNQHKKHPARPQAHHPQTKERRAKQPGHTRLQRSVSEQGVTWQNKPRPRAPLHPGGRSKSLYQAAPNIPSRAWNTSSPPPGATPRYQQVSPTISRDTSIFASPRQVRRHMMEQEERIYGTRPRTYQQDSALLLKESLGQEAEQIPCIDRSATWPSAAHAYPLMPDLSPVGQASVMMPDLSPVGQARPRAMMPNLVTPITPKKHRSCSLDCIPEQDGLFAEYGRRQVSWSPQGVSPRSYASDRHLPYSPVGPTRETVAEGMPQSTEQTPLLADLDRRMMYHLSHQPLSPPARSSSLRCHSSAKRSRRSRHMMRHQSVDLFMMDHVGQEQLLSKDDGKDLPRDRRDTVCAILFCTQVCLILTLGIWQLIHLGRVHHHLALAESLMGHVAETVHYGRLIILILTSGAFASLLSGGMLLIMTIVYKNLIPTSLIMAISLSFTWGILGVEVLPGSYSPAIGFVCCLICTGYSVVIWHRIPFASANLHAALTGVRSSPGLWVVALAAQALILLWTLWWTFTVVSLYDYISERGTDQHLDPKQTTSIVLMLIAMIWAYLWTFQVLVHIVQVTVARVIFKWWEHGGPGDEDNLSLTSPHASIDEEDGRQPENILRSALENAAVKNFGAVCYGSLFVMPVQLSRQMIDQCRDSSSLKLQDATPRERQQRMEEGVEHHSYSSEGEPYDADTLCCIPPFVQQHAVRPLARRIYRLNNDFNSWGFAYVGMYRYCWLDASCKASELLRVRGWSTIANDDLIMNVLFLVSLVIGGCTACFGTLLNALDAFHMAEGYETHHIAFVIGIVVGAAMSHVVMSVVISSVNTVILCYAGRPLCFKTAHPDLSEEMNNSWSVVWPGSLLS